MKAKELKLLCSGKGIVWSGVMLCLILREINKAGLSLNDIEKVMGLIVNRKLSAIKVLRLFKGFRIRKEDNSRPKCPICEGKHRIRVYNFLADFPKNFDKKSLLTVPIHSYSTEIECPKCCDNTTWNNYNQKLKERSELDQEIAKVYLLRYQEHLAMNDE